MSNKIFSLTELKNIVSAVARQYGVKKVYLFGSYARGEATDTSDIDLCVDAENLTTLFDLGSLYADLEKALNKSLDLVTVQSLTQNSNDELTQKLIKSIKKDEYLLYEE